MIVCPDCGMTDIDEQSTCQVDMRRCLACTGRKDFAELDFPEGCLCGIYPCPHSMKWIVQGEFISGKPIPNIQSPPLTRHPAKYSKDFVQKFYELLINHLNRPWTYDEPLVLDPFAGVGLIHMLRPTFTTVGVEIEPEWAEQSEYTYCADSTSLPEYWTNMFQAIITSPTYGNRMADHHDARDKSKRNTYKHALGRDLHHNNTGMYQWNQNSYHDLHHKVYAECNRVLEPGGVFLLNISDHIRKGERQKVSEWHANILQNLYGFKLLETHNVLTPRLREGANADLRVDTEQIYVLRKEK